MNRLTKTLVEIVLTKVQDATRGRSGTTLESRFIFNGPPLDLLEPVFMELAKDGGIQVSGAIDGATVTLPVLLQLTSSQALGPNPEIGVSGKCDESHLLHIRNNPNCPSFIALVPPGQHNNRSVASTTDEFGVNASTNSGYGTFEEWWEDSFIQRLITQGLREAGLEEHQLDDSRSVVEHAAASIDAVDQEVGTRKAVWRLISRVFSIGIDPLGLKPAQAIALACGVPPMQDRGISSKSQLSTLDLIADGMADGFKTGVDRISAGAAIPIQHALSSFLTHLQTTCEVPTSFERSTEAYYLPNDGLVLEQPPTWWSTLTAECWLELMAQDTEESKGDLTLECMNAIFSIGKGMPAVVKNEVVLNISSKSEGVFQPIEVLLTGGSNGKVPRPISVNEVFSYVDLQPSPKGHKAPITYKGVSEGRNAASIRVISLSSWIPGILVLCRMATKVAPPRKPRKSNTSADWETSLSLPGSGRYEILLLTSPNTNIVSVECSSDDATEFEEDKKVLDAVTIRPNEYHVEIEVEGKCQLEVVLQDVENGSTQTCTAYITCEEIKEEGCRSEFERLIKVNRRFLERFDSKTVIQLDRHARSSSLQSWILDIHNVAKSYRPIVLASDYATRWAPPEWDDAAGPILSVGRFLHDPRPDPTFFEPPLKFLEARQKIAERIRATDDQSGLVESAPLGEWLSKQVEFRELVESYLEAYMSWVGTSRDIACWVDVIAVCSLENDGRTLSRTPDAIMLSPMHPLRLAWHCLAQQVLFEEVDGSDSRACPAASILDPDCVPDLLTMSLQAPDGLDKVDFLSVECSSDYWSVLWNGDRLNQLTERSSRAPFDKTFGLTIGGIANGFSPAQVSRALEDVSDLLAAKPIVSLVVSSAGGASDACNEGLTNWCAKRFGTSDTNNLRQGVGPRRLEVFDTRPSGSRPDQATISNLSEDTANQVRWFESQPHGVKPDLGIIAQLDSAQPESTDVTMRSPLGVGGLIRHRVRRQLHGAFLSESRQGLHAPPTGEVFADKVASCVVLLEGGHSGNVGLQFAPNVHAVSSMLEENKAGFVAVSSTAIDPACFLGGWIKGTYLWDYDLPSYSHRAGDTSGYYLLSQVRDADREALKRVLEPFPDCKGLVDEQMEQILLEVARRGIPTVRGLAGDDTGATGDLGLFLAVRLLQDQFRVSGNVDSLLPVLSGSPDDVSIAIIVPVDPFRGYLADLSRSLNREGKDNSLQRPDLLVVGIRVQDDRLRIHLTPVEVKCRQGSVFSQNDAKEALSQAKALASLFHSIEERAAKSIIWRLAFQHLLLSMIGFGLRVYSQHSVVAGQSGRWAEYHQRIAATILGPSGSISIDKCGRLVVIDGSMQSDARDQDSDGYSETIVISATDAGRIVAGDAQVFYSSVRLKVGDWRLLPTKIEAVEELQYQVVLESTVDQSHADLQVPAEIDSVGIPALLLKASPEEKLEQTPSMKRADLASSKSNYRNATGIVLSLGNTVDGFEPRPLYLNVSDTRLNHLNIGVVGDLGTGKTQLLKSLILQITRAQIENQGVKPRLLIFDYKRDYSSADFVHATGARVVKPTQLPLNLFDTTDIGESAAPWLDRFRFFTDVLDKVFSGIGPVQRDKLKGAVRTAYESCKIQGRQPTIYDIHSEYRATLGGKSDSPMAIIDDLVDMEIFARDPSQTMPFNEFLDGVVVISLDALGQDDRSKNMLVAIMLNMFYENMLKTPKRPFVGTDPQLRVIDSYLLVDEADNIMRYEFDVLRKLLLQGREFGTGVILASQYLRHFKAGATDYREPLLTWFIHKVPNVSAAELSALGLTADVGEMSERIKTLANHHCLFKSHDVTGEVIRGLPFYELEKLNVSTDGIGLGP